VTVNRWDDHIAYCIALTEVRTERKRRMCKRADGTPQNATTRNSRACSSNESLNIRGAALELRARAGLRIGVSSEGQEVRIGNEVVIEVDIGIGVELNSVSEADRYQYQPLSFHLMGVKSRSGDSNEHVNVRAGGKAVRRSVDRSPQLHVASNVRFRKRFKRSQSQMALAIAERR